MADGGKPPVWGLWNERLGEWFNPGTQKPFWADEEIAKRAIPKAVRQYPVGKWEVREYPVNEAEEAMIDHLGAPPEEPAAPGPGRAPARSETAPELRP